jgi:hypothetical protein
LYYQRFENIPGSNVSDLTNSTLYPNFPVDGGQLPTFEEATITVQNYGSIVNGYFIAPYNGLYQFAVSGDDSATLSLSSDDNPASKGFITAKVLPPSRPTRGNGCSRRAEIRPGPLTRATATILSLHKQNVGLDCLRPRRPAAGSADHARP